MLTLLLALTLPHEPIQLLDALGDDRFAVRQAAQVAGERLLLGPDGLKAYHIFARAAQHHEDTEVRHRCRRLVETYLDVRPRDYPVYPWLDMLPESHPDRQRTIDTIMHAVHGDEPTYSYQPDWPDYRQGTGILVRQLLLQGVPRPCVVELLDRMVAAEEAYRRKAGMQPLVYR